MPSPSIESPVAEYSQSTRCSPASPGAFTSRPTNQVSGAGQYSVIVTRFSQRALACLLGAGGTLAGAACVGSSPPPTIAAPPDFAPALLLGEPRPAPPPAPLLASAPRAGAAS